MSYPNSQERTIYRSLAGHIQMGFFDDGERFPSVQEIARRYHVSYCPAQRALKALEREGLVSLCRGKETAVLRKPYPDYLESSVFRRRAGALLDIVKSLELISPALSFQGMCRIECAPPEPPQSGSGQGKHLYRMFDRTIRALGSQTILSLYYDVGSFVESAFLDIMYRLYGEEGARGAMQRAAASSARSIRDCRAGRLDAAKRRNENLAKLFFCDLSRWLEEFLVGTEQEAPESFLWEPHKGRTRYCDDIAIELVCKINLGIFPVGEFLPNVTVLADTFHVSVITIRRTMELLSRLGVARAVNGVGTRVVFAGDATTLSKRKELMLDENLKIFLEALQLLTITCESVLGYTFPCFSGKTIQTFVEAASMREEKRALNAVIGASLQAVTRCCPLAAVREIYGKITLLLLKGSVLRLDETGEESVAGWKEISGEILETLKSEDGTRFVRIISRLMLESFCLTKQLLLKMGVAGADEVADPVI